MYKDSTDFRIHNFAGLEINQALEDIKVGSHTIPKSYVCLTEILAAANTETNKQKRFADYTSSETTKEYLEELSTQNKQPIINKPLSGNTAMAEYQGVQPLIVVIKGGNDLSRTGTFAHIEVATHFAQWCSPKFSVAVNRAIRLILEEGFVAVTNEATKIKEELQIISKRLLTDTRIDMTNAFKKYYEAKGCTEQEIGMNIAILTNRIYYFLFHENTKELRIKFKTSGSIRPYLKDYENNMVYDIENHAMTLVLNQGISPDDAITAAFKFYAQYEYFTMQRCPFDLALWEELKSNCGIIEKN